MVSERQTPRHDGRTNDTRQRIVREALRLYSQGGYAGISLDTLAKAVGLTKAALFHHFKNKQELFFTLLLALLETYQRSLEAAIAQGSDTRSRLGNILRAMTLCPFFDPMKFLADEKGNLSLEQQREIERAFDAALHAPVQRVLEMGIRAGEVRPHQVALSVRVFLNLLLLLPSPGNPTNRPGQSLESETLLDLFWHGVGAGERSAL